MQTDCVSAFFLCIQCSIQEHFKDAQEQENPKFELWLIGVYKSPNL